VDDCGSVIGGADIADVDLAELVCTKACEHRSENAREISFSPIILAFRVAVLRDSF
jgi:hypothetical protein